jgi:flagellar biosynthesis protein FlhG
MMTSEQQPRVVAVASGKGGVGKSLLAANLGIFLATLGKRVVLVDAALGSPNLHIFAGVPRPARSLAEALVPGGASLAEVSLPTPVPGMRLVAGAHDPAWVAGAAPALIERLSIELRALPAEWVVLDLGSGTAPGTLELFLDADVGVLVAVPDPTSIELMHRFLRAAFVARLRRLGLAELAHLEPGAARHVEGGIVAPLDLYLQAVAEEDPRQPELRLAVQGLSPQIVVNAARSKADMELGRAVTSAGRRRLGLPIQYLGHLEYDEAVWASTRRRRPLLVEHPEARIARNIEKVTRSLLAVPRTLESGASLEVLPSESHYDLLEVAPTASFEDIRRANRRIRDIYGTESVAISGLYDPAGLEAVHRRLDLAYTTLMDAAKRKEYDLELFPEGVPAPLGFGEGGVGRPARTTGPVPITVPVERPPMPAIEPRTEYSGPLLRQVREALGIELREIAERTKIGMAYLDALESEQFGKLPATVYVRGFLGEYARILGLDGRRVVETYLERYRAARGATVNEELRDEDSSRRR